MASQYGISIKTIYTWLRLDTQEPVVSVLKYNKLKRENEELKRLVGEITLEMSLGKKVELVRLGKVKSIRAAALGIERRNIYRKGKQEAKNSSLKETIEQVWIKHPAYGHKRLSLELKVGKNRILRVMHLFGIKPPRRQSHFYTTRSTREPHKYTNLIKNLVPTKAAQFWCSDLSYIKFMGRLWYLATIEEIYSQIHYYNFERIHTALKMPPAEYAKLVTE